MLEHEVMIRFLVLTRKTDVLIHVERLDVFKRQLASPVELHKFPVHLDGRRPRGQPQHEQLFGRRLEVQDPLHDVPGRPIADHVVVVLNNQLHFLPFPESFA